MFNVISSVFASPNQWLRWFFSCTKQLPTVSNTVESQHPLLQRVLFGETMMTHPSALSFGSGDMSDQFDQDRVENERTQSRNKMATGLDGRGG
jgi:hypothetical protein